MKTRTLLLLAIACGVLILTAGVVQLLRVANDADEGGVETARLGEPVDIGDLRVTVDDVAESAGTVEVTITIGGVADDDGTDRFRLVVGRPPALEPLGGDAGSPPACGATTVEPVQCVLRFELPDDPGTSRVLNLRRGDDAVNWVLTDD